MRALAGGAVLALLIVLRLNSQDGFGQDVYVYSEAEFDPYSMAMTEPREAWSWTILPDGLIYSPYLAGQKESRTGIQYYYEKDDGWSWYSIVGGQLGIVRYGTLNPYLPVGVQLDVEGSAQFTGEGSKLLDLLSTDARFGIPLSIGWGATDWGTQETKLAIYFLHTNPNRSFLDSRPELPDKFFQRRAIVLGHAIHPIESIRLYGEIGYAFSTSMNSNWELQLGAEFAPEMPTRLWGAPFAASNLQLLETNVVRGTFTLQAGWAWRGEDTRLLRIGLFYLNGRSNNLASLDESDQQLGFGVWHDF